MTKNSNGKKGISNLIFIVSISILIIICATFAFMTFIQNPETQTKLEQLQSEYSQLQTENENLQSTYDAIKISNQNLLTNYNTLQHDYDEIESDLFNLQNTFNQLNTTYQELLSTIPSQQPITIDSIYYKPHYLTPSGVYNVTVRNHLQTEIHVTTLKLYHESTLISSKAVSVNVPANSAVTIEEFLPFSLTENLHVLKIETLEGYTTTSDPLDN